MKTKTREKTIYETYYVACDGTEFTDEKECEKYERDAKTQITKAHSKLNLYETNGDAIPFSWIGADDIVTFYKVETMKDVETINEYLKAREYDCIPSFTPPARLGADAIGTTQIIVYDGNSESDYWILGSIEKVIRAFTTSLEAISKVRI